MLQTENQPILPEYHFAACPIRASLGVLGRKWTLLILRDMAFLKIAKFSQLLKNNQGLTPRALSLRLRDLQREGLIERIVNSKENRDIKYKLTQRGRDSIPILTAFIQYGMKHHAERVFEDGKPRTLNQVFPQEQETLLGQLITYATVAKNPQRN